MSLEFSFSQNTVGYIIDGVMDKTAINDLKQEILKKFETHDIINLYLEDSGIERFSINAVLIATIFPVEYHHRFGKIALVTDRRWIHALGFIDTLLVKVEIKNYTTEKRMDAMSWIAE